MRSSHFLLLLIALFGECFALRRSVVADDPVREEFIQLVSNLDNRVQLRHAELGIQRLIAPKTAIESYQSDGLAPAEFDALLNFEAAHPASDLGLMALRKIILVSNRNGVPSEDIIKSKREALRRLPAYASQPILGEVLSHLADSGFVVAGYVDRDVGDCLLAIMNAPNCEPSVLATAKLKRCDWIHSFETFVQHRDKIEKRLVGLRSQDDAESIMSVAEIEFFLPLMPTEMEYRTWKAEANQLLAQLTLDASELRTPVVTPNSNPDIVAINQQLTAKQPTLAELARTRVRHRVGSLPEEVRVTLLDDKVWSLSAQRGKLVVIQFSSSDCVPCKRMYPILRELAKQFSEKLTVLTVMQDLNPEIVKAAVEEYGISWSVVCDSEPGGLTARWGVESFPTVFIIGRDGRFISLNANENQDLVEQVLELTKD